MTLRMRAEAETSLR